VGVSRVFKRSGRNERRRVEVRLSAESREAVADLLTRVHDLLTDPRAQQDAPVDPLEELTGLDASAFDTSAMDDPFGPPARTPRAPFFAPDDPAVARLLPDANREDPVLAEEFRRLTEHGLRLRKQEALALAAQALVRPEEPVRLTMAEAEALLKSLTDVRLVLAERLGLRSDGDAEALHDMVSTLAAVEGIDEADLAAEELDAEASRSLSRQPWVPVLVLYDQLTALQEDLVQSLMG